MLDPELLERITARRGELDELEERLAKQLAEVLAERGIPHTITTAAEDTPVSASLPVRPPAQAQGVAEVRSSALPGIRSRTRSATTISSRKSRRGHLPACLPAPPAAVHAHRQPPRRPAQASSEGDPVPAALLVGQGEEV
ncbi:hypothetical protein [Streptomyces paradoxus]|uniref:Uncharacterized protein n=1 Tax=Streptomyces paradoxus TaxID=66375 RepID=A0A7W9TKL8_9ACTN|nr:hypothetical protein [Streptomyces paradoxus]MBB6081092.1 hypothetical protein [Streptomyces paradoxus]